MRWSGPGLAIPFPSNLCPSPSPVAWFAHFMNWNVSVAGIPFSIRPARHPRAVVPPWTHHQPRWPWRRAAYACAPPQRHAGNNSDVPASLARSHAFLHAFRLTKRAITDLLSKLLQALSCSHTRVHPVRGPDVSLKLDDDHQNSRRHVDLCVGETKLPLPVQKVSSDEDRHIFPNLRQCKLFFLRVKQQKDLIDCKFYVITYCTVVPWMYTFPGFSSACTLTADLWC